jgi:hypothetical protein
MNEQLILIEKLKSIQFTLDCDNPAKISLANEKISKLIDDLQEEFDKVESDIDVQLQLENESKYGK